MLALSTSKFECQRRFFYSSAPSLSYVGLCPYLWNWNAFPPSCFYIDGGLLSEKATPVSSRFSTELLSPLESLFVILLFVQVRIFRTIFCCVILRHRQTTFCCNIFRRVSSCDLFFDRISSNLQSRTMSTFDRFRV